MNASGKVCKHCQQGRNRHHWKNAWCPHPDKDANMVSGIGPIWLRSTFEPVAEPSAPAEPRKHCYAPGEPDWSESAERPTEVSTSPACQESKKWVAHCPNCGTICYGEDSFKAESFASKHCAKPQDATYTDVANLRFYADMANENDWDTLQMSSTVVSQTLRGIADRLAAAQPVSTHAHNWILRTACSVCGVLHPEESPVSAKVEEVWHKWHKETYGDSVKQYEEHFGWRTVAWKFAEYYAAILRPMPPTPKELRAEIAHLRAELERITGERDAANERADSAWENLLNRRKHDDAHREECNQLAERAEAAESQRDEARAESLAAAEYQMKVLAPKHIKLMERAEAAEATIERLTRERDEARQAIAWANNSLYGSHGFFLSVDGGEADEHHLDSQIEVIKTQARKASQLERSLQQAREALELAVKWIANPTILAKVRAAHAPQQMKEPKP